MCTICKTSHLHLLWTTGDKGTWRFFVTTEMLLTILHEGHEELES